MNELERVALLAARFGTDPPVPTAARLSVGIGDDAAVVEVTPAEPGIATPLVWTIDAQVEGTHFRLDWLGWEDVGWRSFMAAASDLAAMGATPVAALSALTLASAVDDDALDALARGQAAAARAVGAPIVGGNLARGTETSVTTTLLGRVARPVLRSGARPGDGLYLAGPVGMAAAGLGALERGAAVSDVGNASIDACIQAWRRPRALLDAGAAMSRIATAAVDVSDGLARDARHIADASGVTLVLEETLLRARSVGALETAAALLGRDVLELVLGGGEDYALLVASPSAIPGFDRIGTVETGPPGVNLTGASGRWTPLGSLGFDHFR